MTGAEIDAQVQVLADELKILAIHFPDSRRVTGRGWVDWVLVGPRGVLFREVKGDGDELSGAQRALGYALTAQNLDWGTWRTGHLTSGGIEADLEAIAHG